MYHHILNAIKFGLCYDQQKGTKGKNFRSGNFEDQKT